MLDPTMMLQVTMKARELEREARHSRLVRAAAADRGRRPGALRRALGAGLLRLGGWLLGPDARPAVC